MKLYFVYIITNKVRGILYIGVTNDIARRMYEHKNKMIEGFSKKYSLDKLVYCESCNDVEAAINREKMLKKWDRLWKVELIEQMNPNWNDLSENGFPPDKDTRAQAAKEEQILKTRE
jgi:putative endonuclease